MNVFFALIVCAVSYFSMVEGWGLEVHSWGWVIGLYSLLIIPALIKDIAESIKD